MRILTSVVVVVALLGACGPAPRPDAGVGGGGGSLFGGGTGGSGGGSTGGGGGDVDAGFDAGIPDAGQVDAGPTETFRFRVVQGPLSQPVANVAVRIQGPSTFVDGYSNGNGDVAMALPGLNQRPLSLTLTRLDHGALSFIGLTSEFPAQVRFDPIVGTLPTEMVSGSITGKLGTGRVVIDSIDFFTTSSLTGMYASQFVRTSPQPLPIVAMELDATNELVNWTVIDGGTRVGTKMIDIAFPSPAEVPSSVPWSATYPDSGILTFLPTNPFLAGWHVVSMPTESWVTTGAGSAVRDGGTIGGNLTSLTGPLAPNRLLLELTDGSSYLMRHRQHDLTPPIAFRLPEVTQISITGTTLGNLAAAAAAPASAFDTFCITVEPPNANTWVWRVCTAPGAPFTIARLPDLPEDLRPSDVNIASPGSQLGGLAVLMSFDDPAMRPWLIMNTVGPSDVYEDTFGGGYQTITGAWR